MASIAGLPATSVDVTIQTTWTASCPFANGTPTVPLLYLPYLFARSHGLRTTRQVAGSLGEELGY